MSADWGTYISMYFFTMLKYLAGPSIGASQGISIYLSMLINIASMMTVALVFSYFGLHVKALLIKWGRWPQQKFSPKSRRFVTIWKKYGLIGIAFFTPILFMPIPGVLIASTLEDSRKAILFHMLWSSVLWSVVFNLIAYQVKDWLF